jgi:hypothetical protein
MYWTDGQTDRLFLHENPQFLSAKGTTKKAEALELFVYPNLRTQLHIRELLLSSPNLCLPPPALFARAITPHCSHLELREHRSFAYDCHLQRRHQRQKDHGAIGCSGCRCECCGQVIDSRCFIANSALHD